ncbi:DinB family protein [Planococcus salinus]|uniref:DUF664 domain-containing protein n=1 Tax=Planococcus salinus TaxID=1848460 RepID=A0A3M8P9H7_9BACL|nr:DinB family protein [Planococcus salinus]RNF39910.1 hypothetical protein EEX84_08090 [Planococcus salinus]
MFSTMDEFFALWQPETDKTRKVFDALTDESLGQQVTSDHRTLGRLAWHLTTTFDEMMGSAGLELNAVKKDAPMPDSASAISEGYRKSSQAIVEAMREQWTDRTLTEERDLYGRVWKVKDILYLLVAHQIHHRGQMTVLMRQAGLKVPGVYGPSKEDWSVMGTKPPEI